MKCQMGEVPIEACLKQYIIMKLYGKQYIIIKLYGTRSGMQAAVVITIIL